MARYLVFLVSLCAVSSVAIDAFACKCEREDRETSYRTAKAVFFGEASEDGATIKVLQSYKGTRKKRNLTVEAEDSCDVALSGGKKYMVYASEVSKKTVKISACSATEALEYKPITASTWSYGEELPYGTSRKMVKKHADQRAKLEKAAKDRMQRAAKSCAKSTWAGKEKVSAHLRVRFDVQPTGEAEPVILKYEPKQDPESDETQKCLVEELAKTKFKKFSGGPLSVRAYWMLNRIDKKMKQEKKGSQVIPYKKSEEDDNTL